MILPLPLPCYARFCKGAGRPTAVQQALPRCGCCWLDLPESDRGDGCACWESHACGGRLGGATSQGGAAHRTAARVLE